MTDMVNISVANAGITAILGYLVVFVGLILLMLVVMLMGKIMVAQNKKAAAKAAAEPAPAAQSAPVSAKPAPGTAGELKLYDTDPRDAAMVMAIVADTLGKPLNELRFISIKEVKEDDFDVESELKQPCFSKEGDLWHLGKHIVLCGDSTKAECYDTLMDGTKANLVLSDPPYNVDVEETAGKIMNDNMGDSEFYQFLLAAFQQMHGHLADDGSIYIFHADTEGLNFRKAFKDAGFYLSGCCIWKKNALVLGRSPYQWQHEPCLYGWKQKGKHQWYSDRKQTTIWEYDRPKSNKDHPTMKPIGLMSYPIRNSTMTNGIVLDPFLGSGSTLIACEETDRVCRGIELDPKFVDVIVKRYIEHSDGHYDDVYVIRDGQKLKFEEVATFEPESEDADA